jgi:hypothetical protein
MAGGMCTTPGDMPNRQFVNTADKMHGFAYVPAQCTNRTASQAVYCSCRCANGDGKTDDGANYCTCPDGFDCEPLVTSIGAMDSGLTGSYCIKHNTKFDASNPCMDTCDPNTSKDVCGDPNTFQPTTNTMSCPKLTLM